MILRKYEAPQRSKGYSVGETVIAIGVLAILVATVGKFSNYVRGGIEDLRFSKLVQWETQNTRELIGSWPTDQVTIQKIQSIEVSPQIAQYLSNAAWHATVTPSAFQIAGHPNSIPAVTVQLRLTGIYKGQTINPVEHQFWILNETKDQTLDFDVKTPTENVEVSR